MSRTATCEQAPRGHFGKAWLPWEIVDDEEVYRICGDGN